MQAHVHRCYNGKQRVSVSRFHSRLLALVKWEIPQRVNLKRNLKPLLLLQCCLAIRCCFATCYGFHTLPSAEIRANLLTKRFCPSVGTGASWQSSSLGSLLSSPEGAVPCALFRPTYKSPRRSATWPWLIQSELLSERMPSSERCPFCTGRCAA